jgi:hypothetical protein
MSFFVQSAADGKLMHTEPLAICRLCEVRLHDAPQVSNCIFDCLRRILPANPRAMATELLACGHPVESIPGRRPAYCGIHRWPDRVLGVVSKHTISQRIATDYIVGLAIVHSDEQSRIEVFHSMEDRDSWRNIEKWQYVAYFAALVPRCVFDTFWSCPLDALVAAIHDSHDACRHSVGCNRSGASSHRKRLA